MNRAVLFAILAGVAAATWTICLKLASTKITPALGALVITLGIFCPAFAITLVGHDQLERLVENRGAHAFLDGVTAGVVGLISATALTLLSESVTDLPGWIIFSTGLLLLFRWKAKWAVAVVVLGAGVLGWLLYS